MPGLTNLIGTGQAQILPESKSLLPYIENMQQQQQVKFQRDKYEQAKKEQDQKELYGLVGDALNLKDFNPIIHDKVRQAQVDLTNWILSNKDNKNPNMRGETYLKAQNMASDLTKLNQSYNHADQVIAANKKEFEGDKDLNLANIEAITRRYVKDAVEKGQYDPNKNYFTEAMRDNPNLALANRGGVKFDFDKLELLPDAKLTGFSKKIRPRGGYEQMSWKVAGGVATPFYEFTNNGEGLKPTITTRSEPSTIFNGVPMLSEDAWKRYKAVTSNEIKLDVQLKDKYKGQLDLHSPEAEELRRIMAYQKVEEMKPEIIESPIEKADPIRIYNSSGGGGGDKAQSKAEANNWLTNTSSAITSKDINAINSQFQILERGGRFVNVSAKYDKNGNVEVNYSTPSDDGGSFKTFTRTFKNDANLTNQLKGIYQAMTGEDKVFEYSQPNTPKPSAPTKKEIKRSDVATKAAAAGYSVKEYEALLIKNGVTIKD